MFPLIYNFENSFDVQTLTEKYIKEKSYDEKLYKLFLSYHNIGNLIPQTQENFWSGHYFPWMESWDEIQISYNLMEIGLYKQSFYSLRSSFELGLLSVYWNLNDDGHIVIQEWLKSNVDTPRFSEVWEKLNSHPNYQKYQEYYDIKTRLLKLGYLHDYVHSKGLLHSNMMGKTKPNHQTFEADCFELWLESFEEVVKVLSILHLIKYPIGTIDYDFRGKFGIDVPSFGGIDPGFVKMFSELLGEEVFQGLSEVSKIDVTVKGIMNWVESLPTMTEEEHNKQIEDFEKRWIERQGFEDWYENHKKMYTNLGIENLFNDKADKLRKWAMENNFMKSRIERNTREEAT